jgi:hypothetical protein
MARVVDSKIYSKNYYLTINEGGALGKQDNKLTPRLKIITDSAAITNKDVVLDVGCGTGEICFSAAQTAKKVYGIDYSQAAVTLCNKKKKKAPKKIQQKIIFKRMDATKIATLKAKPNKVIMTDIVEHLYPEQLEQMFLGIKKIAAKDCTVYIHTAPNLEFYQYGYPIIRFLYPLLKLIPPFRKLLWTKPNWKGLDKLPKDPEEESHNKIGHVNEQTPSMLKATLEKTGYQATIRTIPFMREVTGWHIKILYSILNLPGLRKVFGAEILAEATINFK